ncbi:MAG TPA: hypothetical protein VG838_06400 [Opitutaceae bacterium]|nr:hypothetical protein [Lacunisphaera sp.]HWA09081.1 hypothetical protein [Opitutaceae bacterium]
MKKILPLLIGLALGAAATWLVLSHPAAAPEPEKPAGPAITTDSASITKQLDAIGLTFAAPESIEISPEIRGYGRVLDPAPLAGLVADLRTAQAAADASSRDFARQKQLHDQGENASQQAVEQAQAAAARDTAQLAAAQTRLLFAWGRPLATRSDLDDVLRLLGSGEAALVRIDLASGETAPAAPAGAWVGPITGEAARHDVELLGSAPAADAQAQGAGYLALWKDHPLPPGTLLAAGLVLPGGKEKHLLLPRGAFVRHEGGVFVYVQTKEGGYERRLVTLGPGLSSGIVVNDGVKENDQVVVTGAQQLLATEILGSAGGEED